MRTTQLSINNTINIATIVVLVILKVIEHYRIFLVASKTENFSPCAEPNYSPPTSCHGNWKILFVIQFVLASLAFHTICSAWAYNQLLETLKHGSQSKEPLSPCSRCTVYRNCCCCCCGYTCWLRTRFLLTGALSHCLPTQICRSCSFYLRGRRITFRFVCS